MRERESERVRMRERAYMCVHVHVCKREIGEKEDIPQTLNPRS